MCGARAGFERSCGWDALLVRDRFKKATVRIDDRKFPSRVDSGWSIKLKMSYPFAHLGICARQEVTICHVPIVPEPTRQTAFPATKDVFHAYHPRKSGQ